MGCLNLSTFCCCNLLTTARDLSTLRSYVVHYLLEQGESPTGKLTCRTAKQGQTHVCQTGKDRRIEKLMVCATQSCAAIHTRMRTAQAL